MSTTTQYTPQLDLLTVASQPKATTIPVFAVRLVREGRTEAPYGKKIHNPASVAAIVAPMIEDAAEERMIALYLCTKGNVTGLSTFSIGDLSSAIATPREVFKAAILNNAASIILCHNHPSGDPTPSPEDAAVTRRLMEAGTILGIEIHDHIVIGHDRHISLKERGLI